MESRAEDIKFQESDENACVVCFKSCLIYSIGSCNHAVCYECSARMRCLCLQNECPICRADLPKVIFTKTVAPFLNLDRELRSGLYEKKFRIAFADLDIQKCFYRLLENRCPHCDHTPFVEFHKLKEHVRKVHELFYCEICTDNLKIFSNERRCYSRSALATHKRVGDPDDKSHKGHPRCDYCELRYLDKDELFRHLRREHYFCHLCDADGVNLFYGMIEEMRDHFKTKHFLCEEDECADEQFTAVFRSEIDLRAHVAVTHAKNMSRMEVKQTRTLDLEFSYTPRGRGEGGGGGERGSRDHRDHRRRPNDGQREFDRIPEQTIVQQPPIRIDSKNEEQFPSLAGPSGGASVQLANTVRHITYGTAGLARTKENFPALGGGVPVVEKPKTQNQSNGGKKGYKMPSASSLLKGSSSSKQQSNRSSASASSVLKPNSSDFPALSGSSGGFGLFPPRPPAAPAAAVRKTLAPSAASRIASKNVVSDYPALLLSTSKKNKKKEELLEDFIEPTRNMNLNSNSPKHRNHVDYVSMAAQVSKVQTVKQKDFQALSSPIQASVPKLSSADNFPTLGGGSSSGSSAPQWLTGGGPRQQDSVKKGKKVHEMPVDRNNSKPTNNGNVKNQEDQKKISNGTEKQKSKTNNNNNKENVLVEKSFPTLSAEATPPPGFVKTPAPKKPPPGFSNISNDDDDSFNFLPPPNMSKRNQALVGEFQKALMSPESMHEFRIKSQMFRDGDYHAKGYYDTCKIVLGEAFTSIFPELLTLLPDIEKQQSLYVVHQGYCLQDESSVDGKKNKKNNKSKDLLEVCATCQQVLMSCDLIPHVQSHSLDNNFPQMSASDAPAVKQWKK